MVRKGIAAAWLVAALGQGAGCREPVGAVVGAAHNAAEVPVIESVGATTIRGVVQAIRFANINKAQGHFTYNVEVRLRHGGLQGARYPADRSPGVVDVRVDKVFWDRLSDAERAAIAPGGPAQSLVVERWRMFEVGQEVQLEATFMAPGLAAAMR